MSGGGVWWAYELSSSDIIWNPKFGRLVGVQCSYYEDPGALKFIPFTVVTMMIVARYPELKAALAIGGP